MMHDLLARVIKRLLIKRVVGSPILVFLLDRLGELQTAESISCAQPAV
jgi:hypothetical protein